MWMLFMWTIPNMKTSPPGPTSTVATATNAPRENTSSRYAKGERFQSVTKRTSMNSGKLKLIGACIQYKQNTRSILV